MISGLILKQKYIIQCLCDICLKTPIEEIQGVNFKDYACGTPEIEKYMKEREL